MDAFLWFGLFVLILVVLMATRAPVAVVMGLMGAAGTAIFVSPNAIVQLAHLAYKKSEDFILIVVPMFVLMGEVLAATGIGRDLFHAAQLWLRRIPGALAIGTIFACAGFGAVCGSSPVTAATIGAMAVPEMARRGYDLRLALGATASGGTLGILIPPSVPMILYGVLTETSIGDLFIAGILPGLMMAMLLSVTIFLLVMRRPSLAPRIEARSTMREKVGSLSRLWPVALLATAVLGSIYTGFATPTEAAGVGAFGAILIAWLLGELKRRTLAKSLDSTVRTTAMFMLLVITGLFVSFVLARLGVPQGMSEVLTSLPVRPWVIIAAICALLVVLGCFMDPMSILVIIIPIFYPAVAKLGYDLVWFGVLVTITIEIAAITPPVGFNLFVLRTVVPGVQLNDVMRGSLIFVVPLIIGMGILVAVPDIALVMPALMK